jgi:hypothetical protein
MATRMQVKQVDKYGSLEDYDYEMAYLEFLDYNGYEVAEFYVLGPGEGINEGELARAMEKLGMDDFEIVAEESRTEWLIRVFLD